MSTSVIFAISGAISPRSAFLRQELSQLSGELDGILGAVGGSAGSRAGSHGSHGRRGDDDWGAMVVPKW